MDSKKLRFIFPHFTMEKNIINSILFKLLHEKLINKLNSIKELIIPSSVEFFNRKSGYILYGLVNGGKFKTCENLSFNFINKGLKSGIIYNTYISLSKKYTNEDLYPIIFSINNPKYNAVSKYSLKICKTINMNQLNNTYVPTSNLINFVNTDEGINQKILSRPIFLNYSPIINIKNYRDTNKIL